MANAHIEPPAVGSCGLMPFLCFLLKTWVSDRQAGNQFEMVAGTLARGAREKKPENIFVDLGTVLADRRYDNITMVMKETD